MCGGRVPCGSSGRQQGWRRELTGWSGDDVRALMRYQTTPECPSRTVLGVVRKPEKTEVPGLSSGVRCMDF